MIANATIKTEEFLEAISAAPQELVEVREGDTLRGSDHLEIGAVEKVVAPTSESEGHLLSGLSIL